MSGFTCTLQRREHTLEDVICLAIRACSLAMWASAPLLPVFRAAFEQQTKRGTRAPFPSHDPFKRAWRDTMINAKELAVVLEQVEQAHRFSGTLLIAQDGEVLFEHAYGLASRQLNVPNTLDTKFHIASLTKMFIAMAVLILYEQEQISLQEKPAAYLPELVALEEDITLHHLLSHTSGLADIYDIPHLRFKMSKLKHAGGDLLSYLVHLPLVFRPGEGWG